MPENLCVRVRTQKAAVILSVQYGLELLLDVRAGERLGREMVRHYDEKRPKTRSPARSCVVVIRAPVAASSIVRALFTLYQHVRSQGGQLFLVGYPEDYMGALTVLGLPALPGFHVAESKEEALKRISGSGDQ